MPDIQTKAQYEQYKADVAAFVEHEQIKHLSTGTKAVDEDGEDTGEPWFSWRPCECCKAPLGGNREYLYAVAEDKQLVSYMICEDCVYYVNYGRLDDSTMLRVESLTA